MPNVLLVANRTVAGRGLLEAVRERHQAGDARFHLVVPRARPQHGNVIYDEAESDAARLRIELAADFLRREGIELTGEIGDEDPYQATMDALANFPADELVVSTFPQTRSGWLRRDLVDRIRDAAGVPVQHVVTDPSQGDLAVGVTLVVANRTATGRELIEALSSRAEQDESRVFVAVVPQESSDGRGAGQARERLNALLGRLREHGIIASGMIGDPDPYTAVMNALDLFAVDSIVISTLPETKSGWLRNDLVERVRNATSATVEHVEVSMEHAAV